MTLLNKIIYIFLGLFIHVSCYSQNLFDENNSYKFANYLFKTRQFNLASDEYERLVQMVPDNNEYKLTLIQSYRFNKNYEFAEKRMLDFFSDSLNKLHSPFSTEYLKIKIYKEDLNSGQKYLEINDNIDFNTKIQYQEFIYLLSRNWYKADSLYKTSSNLDARLGLLSQKGLTIRRKSPAIAAIMSAIIPGTGKVYSGFWKDGLVAFVFVATNAWQTYRGFDRFGSNKPQGWIFGSIATGFYLGNIYGSYKSAKKYNQKSSDEIYNRAKNIIYTDIQ